MPAANGTLQLKSLGKRQMAAVVARAKRLGTTPEGYLKRLLQEDLAISAAARTTPFAQLIGPGREVDERELDRLVEVAKAKHDRRTARKR